MEVDWKHTRSESYGGCVRAVLSKVFATAPLKHGAAVVSKLGLQEDGTIRPSVADRRLPCGMSACAGSCVIV